MNSVVLVGRLTKDPEVRYGGASQTAVARFTLAVDRPFAKEGQQSADFISIICFGKTAELVEKYVVKGQQIAVEGRIQTGSYEKDGKKVYTTDVVADRVEFLGKPNSSNASAPAESKAAAIDTSPVQGFEAVTDDDIPF